MKKILIFTGYYLPHLGGVERYTEKLISELIKLNCKITIVTTNHSNLLNVEKVNKNLSILRLPTFKIFKNRYPILKYNKKYKSIIHKLNSMKFDFVICNTRFYLTSIIGVKYAFKNNIPSLIIEHGSNHFTVNNKILDFFGAHYEHFLTNKIKKYTKNFYGVSERCNDWLKHFNIKANGVMYNSVDHNIFDTFKKQKFITEVEYKDKIIITFAGRIIKEKGIEILLKSFLKLQKKYNKILLFVAGDGPILEELKVKYNNADIIFLGKLNFDKIMTLYNITDIFAHPSMFPEGLPTTILEAGLMKCAVVATDRGGTVEVINNQEYGLICEENEMSLTNNLEKLISDKYLRDKMSEKLHNRIIKEFTWEITSRKLLEEIERYK